MWVIFAFGSALFAGLTAVLAKCGIRKTDSDAATAIRTIVVLNLIISVSGALSAFEMPYVVTKGAFGTSTFFVVMDKLAHTDQKVGLASAMAVVLLVLIMLVTAVQKFVQKKMEEAESRPVPLTVTTEQNYAAKATSATPAGK